MAVKKPATIMRPICGYCNGCKNQQLLRDLYVGIVMVIKKLSTIMRPICRYCNGCKKLSTITRPICRYCNGCKKTSHYYETYMWVLHI